MFNFAAYVDSRFVLLCHPPQFLFYIFSCRCFLEKYGLENVRISIIFLNISKLLVGNHDPIIQFDDNIPRLGGRP